MSGAVFVYRIVVLCYVFGVLYLILLILCLRFSKTANLLKLLTASSRFAFYIMANTNEEEVKRPQSELLEEALTEQEHARREKMRSDPFAYVQRKGQKQLIKELNEGMEDMLHPESRPTRKTKSKSSRKSRSKSSSAISRKRNARSQSPTKKEAQSKKSESESLDGAIDYYQNKYIPAQQYTLQAFIGDCMDYSREAKQRKEELDKLKDDELVDMLFIMFEEGHTLTPAMSNVFDTSRIIQVCYVLAELLSNEECGKAAAFISSAASTKSMIPAGRAADAAGWDMFAVADDFKTMEAEQELQIVDSLKRTQSLAQDTMDKWLEEDGERKWEKVES